MTITNHRAFQGTVMKRTLATSAWTRWSLASILPVAFSSVPDTQVTANTKLNGPLVPGGDVGFFLPSAPGHFQLAPDAARVVYVADQDSDEVFELYSVPTDGSQAPTKLSGTMVAGGDIDGSGGGTGRYAYQISPDSTRVVYVADQDTNDVLELYSVPIDGSQGAIKLNGMMVAGGDIRQFSSNENAQVRFSPDGAWAVYLADQDTNDVVELYSVPSSGGQAPVKLSAGLVPLSFEIGPDSSRVAFSASSQMYSVPLDGSQSPLALAGQYPSGIDNRHRISSDGTRVVFLADESGLGTPPGTELFSVPMDGSQSAVKLNGPITPTSGFVSQFFISPDGNWVVYRAIEDFGSLDEVYSVPIDGSQTRVKLNDPVPPGPFDGATSISISPDSSRVVYAIDDSVQFDYELMSVPIDRSQAPASMGALTTSFQISPDSSRVIFREIVAGISGLYSIPIDASQAAVQVTPSLAGTAFQTFKIHPDGNRVVYVAETATVRELYIVPLNGSQAVRKLNGPLVSGGDVGSTLFGNNQANEYEVSSDGQFVIYRADQDQDEVMELFSSNLERAKKAQAPVPTRSTTLTL